MRSARLVAVGLLSVALVIGCGGDDSAQAPSSIEAEADAEDTVADTAADTVADTVTVDSDPDDTIDQEALDDLAEELTPTTPPPTTPAPTTAAPPTPAPTAPPAPPTTAGTRIASFTAQLVGACATPGVTYVGADPVIRLTWQVTGVIPTDIYVAVDNPAGPYETGLPASGTLDLFAPCDGSTHTYHVVAVTPSGNVTASRSVTTG